MKQNRFKSKVVWASILGALFLLYNAIAAEMGWPTIEDGTFNTLVNSVLSILVGFGILNNPTSTDKF
ncbi:MAG: hypothetical protein IJX99_02230 [Clostridia bacterium]|nr:hypothetical protein [Clostridia bacterium]